MLLFTNHAKGAIDSLSLYQETYSLIGQEAAINNLNRRSLKKTVQLDLKFSSYILMSIL